MGWKLFKSSKIIIYFYKIQLFTIKVKFLLLQVNVIQHLISSYYNVIFELVWFGYRDVGRLSFQHVSQLNTDFLDWKKKKKKTLIIFFIKNMNIIYFFFYFSNWKNIVLSIVNESLFPWIINRDILIFWYIHIKWFFSYKVNGGVHEPVPVGPPIDRWSVHQNWTLRKDHPEPYLSAPWVFAEISSQISAWWYPD